MITIIPIENNNLFSFGCGNNILSKDQIRNWMEFAGILKHIPGYEQFLQIEKQLKNETD